MTLKEAIKHAQEKAEAQGGPCGQEHRQLAGWLEELQELRGRFSPYVKNDPNLICRRMGRNGKLFSPTIHTIPFHTLKAGDIFQLTNCTTGEIVQGPGDGPDGLSVAQGAPSLSETNEPGVYVWGVKVVPYPFEGGAVLRTVTFRG